MILLLVTLALANEPTFEVDDSSELTQAEVSFIDTLDKELLDSEDLGPVESDIKDSFKEIYLD